MTPNDIPNNQNALEPLPEMETYEQAEAVSKERGDHFYLCAFMMKSWVKGLMTEAYVRLAPENQHPEGFLQTGRAWKGFLDIFGKLNQRQFHHSIRAVRRFITYPCWSPADLADYRRKTLALPPISAVYRPEDGILAGLKVALAICPTLQFEQPLWS